MSKEPTPTKPIITPYFSLTRATWMACVVEWDTETGEFRHLVGVQSFARHFGRAGSPRDSIIGLDNRRACTSGCVRGVSGGVTLRGSTVA